MGARPSSFRKGGGFLNNVDGALNAIIFSDDVPAKGGGREPFKPGKVKGADGKLKDRFHTLFAYISVRADGAKEDVETSLFVGGADDFNVSEDGTEIWDAQFDTPEEAEAAEAETPGSTKQIGANTAFGKFVASAVEAGLPESELNETRLEFTGMTGYRYRFVQRKDEDATKRLGKRKDAKTGKEYDRQELLIDQCYGKVEEAPKAGGKPAAAKGGKPAGKGKPAPEPEFDVADASGEALRAILGAEKTKSVKKGKLSVKLLTLLDKKHPHFENREEIRKWVFDDDNLDSVEGVSYDREDGTLTLDE